MARNYINILDSLLQAFQHIARVLPRVDRLKATFGEDPEFRHAVALVFCDVLEFHRRVYKFLRCKGWHFWYTINWNLFEHRFKSILHRLSAQCEILDKEAAAIHFSQMKAFRIKCQGIDDALEQQNPAHMVESVFGWLSADEDIQEERLHRISDLRQPETCNWVLEDPQMQQWVADDSGDPIIWMTGIPGAGKSFVCSLIIDHLDTLTDRSSLYYFCGKQPADENTFAMILRTLAVQLLRSNRDLIPLVYQAYRQNATSRSGRAVKQMLCDLLTSVKVTRLFIDGLDESPGDVQENVLKSLRDMQTATGSNCKLLISSRETPQIRDALSPKSHLRLGGKTSKGLGLYIKAKVKALRTRSPDIEKVLADRVTDRLESKAQGMFLWVRLVADMLMRKTSEAEVEESIDQLPDGLNEAYQAILERINSSDSTSRGRAFKILHWLSVSYRPMTVCEIVDGIALHPGQRQLNRKTRSNNPQRHIIDLCAPLLEESFNGTLELVHFSAKEYLINEQSGPFVNIATAHFDVAFSCVINLSTALILVPRYQDTATESDLESQVVKGNFGLQSYGQEHWAEHAMAYLAECSELNMDTDHLISALRDFSRAYKRRSEAHITLSTNVSIGGQSGLIRLRKDPMLHNFVSSWLHFKTSRRSAKFDSETIKVQQEWRVQTDETYLSLIDFRLNNITDRILAMDATNLPSHIESVDYKYFVQRFKPLCRFSGCNLVFDTCNGRDIHEATHVPSYPCLLCDFVTRPFRTRKELERHTRKYHISPEDFEIPTSISSAFESSLASDRSPMPISTCWNEHGRQALQQGFRRVLAKAQARVDPIALPTLYENNVENIKTKIDSQT